MAPALNGTTVIKLNGSGTNDGMAAGGNLNYGGTLSLANISGQLIKLALDPAVQDFYLPSHFLMLSQKRDYVECAIGTWGPPDRATRQTPPSLRQVVAKRVSSSTAIPRAASPRVAG